MRLCELNLELCRAQLQRQSVQGVAPRIMGVTFHPMDDVGKVFSCRATFAYGCDFVCQFELDGPANLNDSDWAARLDAALFGSQAWPQ